MGMEEREGNPCLQLFFFLSLAQDALREQKPLERAALAVYLATYSIFYSFIFPTHGILSSLSVDQSSLFCSLSFFFFPFFENERST